MKESLDRLAAAMAPAAPRRPSVPLRYGCAIFSVALAILARLLLAPVLGEKFPFSALYLAILLTAWFAGSRPALLAVVLGGLASDYFLLPPRGSFALAGLDERVGMLLYLGIGAGIAALGGAMEAARERLERGILERTAELEKSRQLIQQSQLRMSGIVNSAMDAIISVDSAQRVVLFNAAAEKMFRCPAAGAMGQPLDRFIPRRFQDRHRRHVAGFGETGVTARSMHSLGEVNGLRGDGQEFPIEASISQIEVAGEKIYTVIIRDVTERRQSEAAGILLAAIVESSTDAIVGKDLNGIVTSWNSGAEGMFGYTAAEMAGQSITRIIPPELHKEEERTLARIRAGERVEHFDTVRIKKDGQSIHVSLTISPIKNSAGRIIGASKVARDITEWKRAQTALRESEERMHAVTDNLNEGLIVSDIDGHLFHWNRASLEMLGYDKPGSKPLQREEFAESFEFETLDGKPLPMDQWPLSRILRGGRLRDLELRIRRRGKRLERIFSYSGAIVHNASGKPLAFLVFDDVTARKQAEHALREREEQLRLYAEHSPAAIAMFDRNMNYLVASQLWLSVYRIGDQSIIGRSHYDVFPEISQRWRDIHQRCLAGAIEKCDEDAFPRADGTTDWLRWEVRPWHQADGSIGGIIVFSEDITARKMAEQALREGEERFRTMANSIPQLAWNAYADGSVFWYNDRWYDYTGTTLEEMEGLGWQRLHDPEVLPKVIERWKAAIESGTPFEMEFPLRGADGRFRQFLTRVQPLKDARGRVMQWFGTNTDVTEIEDRVIARTAQLDAANKELEAFSYSVSHDLRAPLRAVDGFSQAVLEDYGALLPQEGQRYLGTIRKSAQQMAALIDDLLAFSRLSRAPLNKREVDTGGLVRSVLADLAFQLNGRNVDVRIGDLPACLGDRALLQQVWINLLSNALKYTQKREAAVVEAGCERTPAGDVFFVRDNGTGFDMRYAHKLFGVFQRLHRAEDYEGTGVGLAIVQRVINRHGGRIWADAVVDSGATFYFTLGPESRL